MPRPTGNLPSSSGIYCIRCKVNDAVYIGETKQRRGISGRCNSHISLLIMVVNNQNGVNSVLQYDWNLYGEHNFEFLVLEKGHEWNNDVKTKSREQQLINLYRDSGAIVYNFFDVDGIRRGPSCPLALRETILRNQSLEFREYISRLNTGRPNINRKGVICEGNTYLSVLEAASVYQCTPKVIRDKANGSHLDYTWATAEQIQLES